MNDAEPDLTFRDVAPALEFMCWVTVGLTPLLRLVNGPAVTGDQFVVQVGLFSLALAGGVVLRIFQLRRR